MIDSILSFYTTKRTTRFLFVGIAMGLAAVYVLVNQILISRSEETVSYEVAAILILLMSATPFSYLYYVAMPKRRVQVELPSRPGVIEFQNILHRNNLALGRELGEELSASNPLLSDMRRLVILTLTRQRRTKTGLTIALGATLAVFLLFVFNRNEHMELILSSLFLAVSSLVVAFTSRRYEEELLIVLIDLAAKSSHMRTKVPVSKNAVGYGSRTATREPY